MASAVSLPPFDSKLFVGRQRQSVVNQLHHWLTQPSPRHRIQSVTGAPGMGKTWVLRKIQSDLTARGADPNPSPLVVTWIDVPSMVTPSPAAGGFPTLNLAHVQPWFVALHAHSSNLCPGRIDDYRRDAVPSAWISGLARDVCRVAGARLVVLVDGHDEVDRDSARLFDQLVLVQLSRYPCARVIVARREDLPLNHYQLNATENRIELGPESMLDAQGRTLFGLPPDQPLPLVAALQTCLPRSGYAWDHPLINHWLLNWALQYGQPNPCAKLDKNVLLGCAEEVFARPKPPPLASFEYTGNSVPPACPQFRQPFNLLFDIATGMQSQWTDDDLERTLPPIRRVAHDVQYLYTCGLLLMDRSTQRRAIPSGVRELLRDIKTVCDKEGGSHG